MEFEHVVTLLALALGPAGIWFGWWLSERTAAARAEREAEEADRLQRHQRVLAMVRLARRVEADGRDLAHAAYVRRTTRTVIPEQRHEMIRSFNEARAELATQVAEARILGPDWVVERAMRLEADGLELVQIVNRMDSALSNPDVELVQARVVAMAKSIDDLVTESAARLAGGDRKI